LVKKEDYDILYMHHFLASRPVAPFKEAKKRGKQVVFDIHEYHPENFLNNLEGFTKKMKEAVVWNLFNKQINFSDKLVFVSKDMKNDVFKSLGIEKSNFILKNYAKKSVESKTKKKSIAFVGGVNRNLDDEKEILKNLINRDFRFNIIGMETDYFSDIEHNATSFLPYDEMMIRLSEEAFSLISFNTVNSRSYKNDVFSLPNKYYDSIAAETPVIVRNSFVSMVKEVKEKNIGVVVDPTDVKGSVEKIEKAYENYEEMIENIRKYKHEFVWNENIEKDFVKYITQ
jgi:glycosyltransferase involved in cell wall biosynthesis